MVYRSSAPYRARLVLAGGLIVALTSCSTLEETLPDRRPDYRQSRVGNPLELPPDLVTSSNDELLVIPDFSGADANLSRYTDERASGVGIARASDAVLREVNGISLERADDRYWLVVEQPAGQIWPKLKEFWTANGFALRRADPGIGIMETDWAENRADIPDGPVRQVLKFVGGFAYSAATRDKFRTRIDQLNPERTEIYLTHYGIVEENSADTGLGSGGNRDRSDLYRWQPRPRDPELEVEMLRRLMLYLGASEQRAEAQITQVANSTPAPTSTRALRVTGPQGQAALRVEADYADAWRLVGLALDGNRYAVEDQNRAEGLYVVINSSDAPGDERGTFDWLRFWESSTDSSAEEIPRYRVRLADQGSTTLVVVQNDQGGFDNSPAAAELLDTIASVIN